ncbi:LCP family protein [Spirulina major CS-329]|uniref:LCP family protein n=1 Tax=Spirulina subsalsa TaxID=54311 RepID=UPI00232DA1D9|nr:LCP family protein [Spirulina subsalsa]MDB9495723.1 LCP family protein [Spirulina subsalsa CS-330]MDB9501991.1 LCP family protein [Spirulina major CS-329]
MKKSVAKQSNLRPQPTRKPTASAQYRKKSRGKASPKPRWLWIWLGLTGIGMVSAIAGALLAISLSATPLRRVLLSSDDASIFSDDQAITYDSLSFPKLTRPVNLLILGTKVLTSDLEGSPRNDLGYHALVDSFDGLADTMLLIRFDPERFRLAALSIPRDTQVYIEGYGEMKINAANHYGGAPLTARTVSRTLDGVPIDRYLRINVQGVEKLIDALGGVTVYVPKDMKYTDHSQHLYIDLKEGEQHLDGEKAMQFLRFRYDKYGDIGRVQRQQVLIRAVIEQALRPQTLLKLPKLFNVVKESIDTNLTVEELAALAGFAANTKRDDVQMLMLPGSFNGTGEQGVSYWIPNERGIQQMVATHFGQGYSLGELQGPGAVRVAIQDSTGSDAAIAAVQGQLRSQGYGNFFMGDRWHEPLATTRIIAQQGDEQLAMQLQLALGIGEVRVESTGELSSDLTIQLGQDWPSLNRP